MKCDEQAFPPPEESNPRGIRVCVNGRTYENLRHAYESLRPRCSFNALRARLRYHWSIEEALDLEQRIDGRKTRVNARKIEIDSETLSLSEAASRFRVACSTILYRLNRGATHKQAVGLDHISRGELLARPEKYKKGKKREKKVYTVDGVSHDSVAALARAHNLSPTLVYNRIHKYRWSIERAVKEGMIEPVEVQGTKYRSAMNAWTEVGKTSFTTYQSRKTRGLPLDVCLGLKPLPVS